MTTPQKSPDKMSAGTFRDYFKKGIISQKKNGQLSMLEYLPEEPKVKGKKPIKKEKKPLPNIEEMDISVGTIDTGFYWWINSELITLNDYVNLERANKFGAASIKKHYTELCMVACEPLRDLPLLPGPYNVEITWHVNHNKDHDNVKFGIKFILDGAVEAGIISNDNPKVIHNFVDNFVKSEVNKCLVQLICVK